MFFSLILVVYNSLSLVPGLVVGLPTEKLIDGFESEPEVSMTCLVLINHTVMNL